MYSPVKSRKKVLQQKTRKRSKSKKSKSKTEYTISTLLYQHFLIKVRNFSTQKKTRLNLLLPKTST